MENQKEENKDSKSLWQRSKTKIIAVLVIFVGFWFGGGLGVGLYLDNYRPYLLQNKNSAWVIAYADILEKQMEAEKNDFYGGDTPEETIDLFIEALKKEDYDLAVKYFAIEEQEKWKENLIASNKKNLDEWVVEIENNKKTWRKEQQNDGLFVIKYNTGVGDDEVTNFIYFRKNFNNKWKITLF